MKFGLTVMGQPVGQGRTRQVGRTRLRRYPTKTQEYMNKVSILGRALVRKCPDQLPLDRPLKVQMIFYLRRPKALVWATREMPWIWAPVKPDVTNLAKAIEDALNGIVWGDDAQIVDERILKRYCPGPGYGNTEPRAEVVVEEFLGG